MIETTERQSVKARLSWALLWIAVVIFLGALLWGMLNPHFHTMTDVANQTSTNSAASDTGMQRVSLVWKLWPLWFGLGLLYYGYRRAINESKQVP